VVGGMPRRAARKGEQAWLRAVALWRQGSQDAAGDLFEEAAECDPTAADAWLGVHAAGRRRQEALAAMNDCHETFGQLRAKHVLPLRSRFDIGYYVSFRLETPRDLWVATTAALISDGRLDDAGGALAQAVLDCDETRFLCVRHAYLKPDWHRMFTLARGIQDPYLQDEAQLYVGLALATQQVHHEALDVLAPLPRTLERGGRFEAEAAYFKGRACEGMGEGQDALRHYQHAFRLWPELLDVAERARARPVSVPAGQAGGAPAPKTPAAPVKGAPKPPASPAPAASGRGAAADAGAAAVAGKEPGAAPTADERAESLRRALAQLDAMVGLEPVKQQVRTMVAQLRMAALREDQGLPSAARPHHLVFSGPPGTGKTSVARIIGEVFAGLGLLARGHVVEAQRVDLVGQHLGSTAIKTSAVIDKALDGVLFVDEAYGLVNSGYAGGDAFGSEALQVLLKRAEDDRDRLVVVLAGYGAEIAELLTANPGLASRFTTRVEFPSYSADELLSIARSSLAEHGDALAPEAEMLLAARLAAVVGAGRADELGNGRFVRELCLKAGARRDVRLTESLAFDEGRALTREEITTLLFADVDGAFRELAGAS
jgi:tetratricopeptide (TPR) repeat protein